MISYGFEMFKVDERERERDREREKDAKGRYGSPLGPVSDKSLASASAHENG
jgi:hypothetical protein